MEPDLQVLKDEVMQKEEKARVKFFRVVSRDGNVCVGNELLTAKEALENEINEFLSTKDRFYINDVKFHVVKNFLPQTAIGEFEEVWYAMVFWDE